MLRFLLVLSVTAPVAFAQSTVLDVSGVAAFWRVCDPLAEGETPSEAAWEQYFATPGLTAFLQREPRRRASLTMAIPLACDPARAAEADSMVTAGGYVGEWLVPHLRRVAAARAQTADFLAQIDLDATLDEARHRVQAYLPAGLTEAHAPPPVSVTHFVVGGRGYRERIVSDAVELMEMYDPVAFFAHEFHHSYRARVARPWGEIAEEHRALVNLLVRLEEEGIADRLDKAHVPTLSEADLDRRYPSPLYRAFHADYQRHYAEVPRWLSQLDAALVAAVGAPEAAADAGAQLAREVPFGGRPAGAYMARRIEETLGRERLVATVGDPFAFLLAYQDAARRGNGPPLSAEALAAVQTLQRRY